MMLIVYFVEDFWSSQAKNFWGVRLYETLQRGLGGFELSVGDTSLYLDFRNMWFDHRRASHLLLVIL